MLQLALRYGLTSCRRIDNADFVSSLVFDTGAGRSAQPKARFAYLFPSKNAALIQVRMRPDLSDAERRRRDRPDQDRDATTRLQAAATARTTS